MNDHHNFPRRLGLALCISFIGVGLLFLIAFLYGWLTGLSESILGVRLLVAGVFFTLFGSFYFKLTVKKDKHKKSPE